MDKENDKLKVHDRLTTEQLEAVIPRIVENEEGEPVLEGAIPRVFSREDGGKPYLVFFIGGSFHVFKEVEAKQAAFNCGIHDAKKRQTNEVWKNALWERRYERFCMTSIEGVKLIYPDGREEYVSEMKVPDERQEETPDCQS